MAQSSILLLSSGMALNCSQSLQDPSSHHIYSKALTGGQTERKENLASLLADTGCCKPSGWHAGIATAEQTPEWLQGLLLLQLKFGQVGTREGNIWSVFRFASWSFKFVCAWELVRKEETTIVSDRKALQCSGAAAWCRNWDGTNLPEGQASSPGAAQERGWHQVVPG